MSTLSLPAQPEIVRDWMRRSKILERQAESVLFSTGLAPDGDVLAAADRVLTMLNAAFVMPENVRLEYERWATEYNAVVAKIRAERQARANAREVARVRASACPRCFATHAGEC